MRSEAGWAAASWAAVAELLLFLRLPIAFILLYAFTTEDKSYQSRRPA